VNLRRFVLCTTSLLGTLPVPHAAKASPKMLANPELSAHQNTCNKFHSRRTGAAFSPPAN